MDKSFVTLEQHICLVCGKAFDTGNLLLDRRLLPSFETHTTTDFGFCPEHKKMKDDGWVALVGCDPARSAPTTRDYGETVKPEDAYRTGVVAHVRPEVFRRIFPGIEPPASGIAFAEQAVLDLLATLTKKEESCDGN